MLPEGYYDCIICSTPTHGTLCDGCENGISKDCKILGLEWIDYKTKPLEREGMFFDELYLLVQPIEGGRKRWRKQWKLAEEAYWRNND